MKKYIVLLDILGFKDLINNNPHDEVIHIFNNFRIYVQGSLSYHKSITRNGYLSYDVSASNINSIIISDTLIFWTNDDSIESFFQLIDRIQDLLSFCHNLPKIFLRGSLSYGDFFYHNNGIIKGNETLINHPIIFGKGLVEAYEMEKKLSLAGCIISETAIKIAREKNSVLFEPKWDDFVNTLKVVKYEVPLKKETIQAWTINWVRTGKDPSEQELKDGFSSFNRTITSNDVQIKLDNTVNYYLYIKKHFESKD